MDILLKEILISEKGLTNTNYERSMSYGENNLIDSDGNMYLTVDSLIEIKDITTGSNNVILRKINGKPCGFDKIYMTKI